MVIVEIFMIAILAYVLVNATITDIRESVIENGLIKHAIVCFSILDIIYYSIWGRSYIKDFLINLGGITLVNAIFYLYHLWAAGDSKLLFVCSIGVPAKLYSNGILGPVPEFLIVVIVFSTAFLYVVGESFIRGIKDKSILKWNFYKIDFPSVVISYFFMMMIMTYSNYILLNFWDFNGDGGYILLSLIDFLITLTIIQVLNRMTKRLTLLITVLGYALLLFLNLLNIASTPFFSAVNWKMWLFAIMLLALRAFSERYNYTIISVKDLKERMIPSAGTVIQFQTSRVEGLPDRTTEDLDARINKNQLAAIRRWSKTKKGSETIVIVRKVPFAVFITIGTFAFLAIEGVLFR